MELKRIICLANKSTKIQFLAMERSLRAVGCQLPIWVIPYDDNLFELPEGSIWWEIPAITSWLSHEQAHPMMRKYQCLTIEDYQSVDSDVCFVRDPVAVLREVEGFVTSCGHWHNPSETLTKESTALLKAKSTVWQQTVFNAGQFACDRALYTIEELKKIAMSPAFIDTCVRFKWHDQPGLNMLVHASDIAVVNLTLPPVRMESTWAGDYPGEYTPYWTHPERKPYLIHWAGGQLMNSKPVNEIFYQYLTSQERQEWDKGMKYKAAVLGKESRSLRARAHHVKQVVRTLLTR